MQRTSALPVALYARVSTDRQAEAQTVDSQVRALRERIAQDRPSGAQGTSILEFIDEGYSGSSLVRPAASSACAILRP
ncbi:MAG: recombinase family protein [Ktedonobacterales bacterium]